MNNAAGLVGGAARPWPVMEAQHYPAQLTSRCQKRPTVRARSSARPLIDPGPSRVGGPRTARFCSFFFPKLCCRRRRPELEAVGARVRRFFAARLTRTCSQVWSRRTSPLSLRALVSFLPVRTVHSGLGGGVGGFALPRALIPWPLAEQGGSRCSVSSIVWFHSSG